MAPIFDLYCETCNQVFERTIMHNETICCPLCESDESVRKLPSAFSGYKIKGDNSASTTTPRHFRRDAG